MASRPLSAAAKAAKAATGGAGDPVDAGGPWTEAMVQTLAAVVAELTTLPGYDTVAIGERVRVWYRFVDVVAGGQVVPAALPLAAAVIRLGASFLQAHPEHVLLGGATWGEGDVEAVASWYGSVDPDDDGVAERVDAFAAVVRSGLVDDDARPLALALLEAMGVSQRS